MPVVQNVATRPGGGAKANRPVFITLVTATFVGYTAASDIQGTETVTTDATGAWSANLTPNSAITPANTYYSVNEDGAVSIITVPATGGPYNLSQLLATPPPTPAAPGITGIAIAANGTVDGNRPGINLVAGTGIAVTAADDPTTNSVDVTITATGGGGGGVTSVNGHTGVVTLAASDVSAIPASAEGAANGVATLDASGHLTAAQAANLLARQATVSADGPPSVVTPQVGVWTPTYLMTSDTGGVWSGWVSISDGAQGDSTSYDVPPLQAGTYSIELRHLPFTNRGIYTIEIDGVSVGTLDGYSASLTAGRSVLTGVVLTAGTHVITLAMLSKNASSGGYIGMVERLLLTRTA
jgi:hypothetical protein